MCRDILEPTQREKNQSLCLICLTLVPALVNPRGALRGSFLWPTWPKVGIRRALTSLGITLHYFWWNNTPAPSLLKYVSYTLSQRSPEGLSSRYPLQKTLSICCLYLLLTSLLLCSCFLRSPSNGECVLNPCLRLCSWGKPDVYHILFQHGKHYNSWLPF